MSLGNSIEELEALDQPRGIVAAANRYAASKTPLEEFVKQAKADPSCAQEIIGCARETYKDHFGAFIAGAHSALAILKGKGKSLPETTIKQREWYLTPGQCNDFAHCFTGQDKECACGESERP